MNAAELARAQIKAKNEIDAALYEWHRCIAEDAEADDAMRRSKARAYITCRENEPKATVALLEAMVDLETADVQKRARLAEGLKRSAAAAFDAKVRWLQALGSQAALAREEARLATWTPREVESA